MKNYIFKNDDNWKVKKGNCNSQSLQYYRLVILFVSVGFCLKK